MPRYPSSEQVRAFLEGERRWMTPEQIAGELGVAPTRRVSQRLWYLVTRPEHRVIRRPAPPGSDHRTPYEYAHLSALTEEERSLREEMMEAV